MTLQKIGNVVPVANVPDVDYDDIVVPCRECETDVPYKSSVLAAFGNNKRIVVCDACCDAANAEEEAKPKLPMIENYISKIYLETDFKLLPKQAQNIWRYGYTYEREDPKTKKKVKFESKKLQDWQSVNGRGVYILGSSRTGKTRTLSLILQHVYKCNIPFKLFEAGQFHSELVDAKKGYNFTDWRDQQINIPVLAIDDLFAEKLTETIQSGLFEIIEGRMARKKPILITTQVKRSMAVQQFRDPQRGEALLNRLRESCDLYVTNQEVTQDEIEEDKE